MLRVTAHHMSFPVTDIDRSADFYEKVLGLQPIVRPDFPFRGRWYQAGPVQVHLIEMPEGIQMTPPPPFINPVERHDAFAIEDYAGALAFLREKDVEVVETAPEIGQLFIADPDGNILELIVDATLSERLAAEQGEQ